MDAPISLSSEVQEAAAWVCRVLGQQVRPHPGAGAQVALRHVGQWLGAGLQGQVPALLCLRVDDQTAVPEPLLCKTGARKRHHSLPGCGRAPRDKGRGSHHQRLLESTP